MKRKHYTMVLVFGLACGVGASSLAAAHGVNYDEVALLKWHANRVTSFEVGQQPWVLAFDGENMWVANYGDGTVTKLRASDGEKLGDFPAGKMPVGLAFDGTHIWVANASSYHWTSVKPHQGDGTLTKLRASDGEILETFPVGDVLNPPLFNAWGMRGLVFDGAGLVWSGYVYLYKLRASDSAVLWRSYTSGMGELSLAFDGVNLWTTPFNRRYSASTGARNGYVNALVVGAGGIAFDGANIWLGEETYGSTRGYGLLKVRASDAGIAGRCTLLDPYDYPVALAFDGVHIWAAMWDSVIKLRASDCAIVARVTEGIHDPVALAFDGTHMWVANWGSNTVSKL